MSGDLEPPPPIAKEFLQRPCWVDRYQRLSAHFTTKLPWTCGAQ